jgi:hypothetical protein
MILLSQWYEPKEPVRLNELKQARARNESSGIFDEIVYLDGSSRILSYADFFSEAERRFRGQPCVVANTDIVFDETAKILPDICRDGRIIALTAWDSPSSPKMLGHALVELARFFSGPQDSLAFIAGGLDGLDSDIPLNTVGCENLLLGRSVRAGFEVFDPAMDVKTWHCHQSLIRNNGKPFLPDDQENCYAYPELTTVIGTGLVAAHRMPMFSEFVKCEVIQTCRR